MPPLVELSSEEESSSSSTSVLRAPTGKENELGIRLMLTVAAGVAVVMGLVSDFWPREAVTPAGGAVAERAEEREMRALFERRLARGEWQMEVTYGDR